MEQYVKDFLDKNSIECKLHTHEPVYTCEEAAIHCTHVPGLDCKNLFVRDKKKKNYFLVIMPANKQTDFNQLAEITGKKLGFASDNDLMKYLKLTPGSVSPMGLINDTENKAIALIDKDVWEADVVSFHPNINTESLEFSQNMFHKLILSLGNEHRII